MSDVKSDEEHQGTPESLPQPEQDVDISDAETEIISQNDSDNSLNQPPKKKRREEEDDSEHETSSDSEDPEAFEKMYGLKLIHDEVRKEARDSTENATSSTAVTAKNIGSAIDTAEDGEETDDLRCFESCDSGSTDSDGDSQKENEDEH